MTPPCRAGFVGAILPALLCAGCAAPGGGADGPQVWVIDDGERIAHDDGDLALARGEGNPVWAPGQPVRLFGLPGEVLALQVVVTAPRAAALAGVTVELPTLERDGDGGAAALRPAAPGEAPGRFAAIERFVTYDLPLSRRSGGRVRGESLGWAVGAMPPVSRFDAMTMSCPDPLIPVALAPPWADYPMTVAPGEHRVVWIDMTLPDALPAGFYRGAIRAASAGGALTTIPVELTVGPVPLPYAAAPTLVFYDPEEIIARTGAPEAVRHYLQLMHRHHLTTVHRINSAADVERQRPELSGALFTSAAGYEGPGAGRPLDVAILGTYGSLGDPSPFALAHVRGALAALDALDASDTDAKKRREVFLYAVDERCESDRAAGWRRLLRQAAEELGEPRLARLRVGQTCSLPPAAQPVDLALIAASALPLVTAAQAARAAGQPAVWIYNGFLPHTGSFLLDGGALSLRLNGWLQAHHRIPRWFYWESTFWNDDNRGGRGPIDPLSQAETFHNQHKDHANGDGVLVYPGQQLRPLAAGAGRPFRSLGFPGVLPSLRLKQWRRGVQDAGYLQLARAAGVRTGAQGDAAVTALVRQILPEVSPDQSAGPSPPWPWPMSGAAFFAARRGLFDIIVAGAEHAPAR